MSGKVLMKSRDKVFAGVCGGIAEYFGIDKTIVRLLTALLFLVAGTGLLAYIVAALVIPNPDKVERNRDDFEV